MRCAPLFVSVVGAQRDARLRLSGSLCVCVFSCSPAAAPWRLGWGWGVEEEEDRPTHAYGGRNKEGRVSASALLHVRLCAIGAQCGGVGGYCAANGLLMVCLRVELRMHQPTTERCRGRAEAVHTHTHPPTHACCWSGGRAVGETKDERASCLHDAQHGRAFLLHLQSSGDATCRQHRPLKRSHAFPPPIFSSAKREVSLSFCVCGDDALSFPLYHGGVAARVSACALMCVHACVSPSFSSFFFARFLLSALQNAKRAGKKG